MHAYVCMYFYTHMNTHVQPEYAVKVILEIDKKAWTKGSKHSAQQALDALEHASACLPPYALREDSELWRCLDKDDTQDWVQHMTRYLQTLAHLKQCHANAATLLAQLDEVERYAHHPAQCHASVLVW